MAVVESVPPPPPEPVAVLHRAPADHAVDDRLEQRRGPLAPPLGVVGLVAVAEGELQEPPQDEQEHADGDQPDQNAAHGLLGEVVEGTGVGGAVLLLTEGELQRQPPDEQVDDAVGHETGADRVVHPVAVVGLLGAARGAFMAPT